MEDQRGEDHEGDHATFSSSDSIWEGHRQDHDNDQRIGKETLDLVKITQLSHNFDVIMMSQQHEGELWKTSMTNWERLRSKPKVH